MSDGSVLGGRYFICYSRVDARDFATRLAAPLTAGPPPYQVWLDVRDARPGADWDDQIRDAIGKRPGSLPGHGRQVRPDPHAGRPRHRPRLSRRASTA